MIIIFFFPLQQALPRAPKAKVHKALNKEKPREPLETTECTMTENCSAHLDSSSSRT